MLQVIGPCLCFNCKQSFETWELYCNHKCFAQSFDKALRNSVTIKENPLIHTLTEKVRIYEEALEFYADESNFTHQEHNGKEGLAAGFITKYAEINGVPAWSKAREALQAGGGVK